MADGKALSLHLNIEPDVPAHIMTDVTRLRQILLNILGNAVKFTPQGSVRVHISILSDGAELRFAVADRGPGIPFGQQAHLFEEFSRLGSDATRKLEGAGLGLSLSSRLAARMGGRMG